ncbi:OOP family OmpA-OmpF porin/peptidoglycan-binding protein ArfA [Kribbella steppae]|uniref:OOP family OmpA-OmpF porin/peptidoglycan-binding protein ArfA n=1 Tax=Kribbella steppae TaxID=2512223 RepID=A0A4R2H6C2_9ACTN|nr:OmpA family protein [Kribbella steppae]TCO21362.1 OOP family OmpA-OmpF porin/peptidoglycan-binding protein ArfA [Kribbella steppae]
MSGLVRRPVVVWLLAALAVPVLITAVLIPAKAGTTEDDIRDRSLTALQARGITGAEVDVDGRDATVVVPAGVEPGLVKEVVAGVEGVRAVRVEGGTSSPTPTPPPTPAPSPTEAPAVASFEVGRTNNSIRVQAAVKDQGVKDAIAAQVDKVLGEAREFDDRITIDAATGLQDATALSALIHALAIGTGDASVRYDGTTITLTGKVPDQATKATVARAAAKAVPGAVIADQLQTPAPPKPEISEACRTFQSRLSEFSRQHSIIFLSGTSIVNNASKPTVVRAATLLKSCSTVRVEIAGHTDNLGSPASSLPLSERRATAVKATLVRLGVPAARLLAHGYGETFPIASNGTPAGRIANRRVELRVLQGNS